MATIEVRDLVREYAMGRQTVRALDGVSATLSAGEFVAIVGPSGSGKSTLVHLLGGLDTPTSGSIVVDGVDITGLSDAAQSDFRRRTVGFVFQSFNLVPGLTAWENVALPAVLDGGSLRRAKPRALELLERVGLGDRAGHRPSELSGGQTQRVAVARALVLDPPVVIADEPTGNLDSAGGAGVLGLLRQLTADGRLVVMVTHDPDAAAGADRVLHVRDGRLADPDVALADEPVPAAGRHRRATL